ncbi:MAG TPA: hypothetical protein VH988_20525 [Thermoanaerobaculia bacterium]|jgi:hypothetical protein|nr:hypothetical protein [Thermoanaerobaculia bacterium]
MTTIRKSRIAVLALTLLAAATAAAHAKATGPWEIALRPLPQASFQGQSPNLGAAMTAKAVRLVIEDGRTGPDPAIIGQTQDHTDQFFPLRTSSNVLAWTTDSVQKAVAVWGIKTANDAPLVLTGRIVQFVLNESTKAVGAMYGAEIQISFTLKNAKGGVLWEGNHGGDSHRFGKSRSEENANEVLVEAIKQACSELFGDAGLQEAWDGKATPHAAGAAAPAASMAPAAPPMTPSALLAELVKLKKQGFDTDLLLDYVNKHSLTAALSADDMVKWKQAGMPPEVIKAALARSGS